MRTDRKRSRGFTLLEVLVAFAILSFSMAGVFGVFSNSLEAARTGQQYSRATALAKARLAAFDLAGPAGIAPASGEDPAGYRWQIDVEEITDAPISPGDLDVVPVAVSVSVEWGSGEGRSVELATIRAMQR